MMKESEAFYEFGDNSFHTRGFTWAYSIRPRSGMVHRVCSDCEAVETYPTGAFDVAVERGIKYPDVLGCGAFPFLIVSEVVITAWHKAKLDCFHTYSVGIAEIKSKKLQGVTPPRYFRVEIDGQCQIDLAASGVKKIRFCPECHNLETRPEIAPGFRMVPGSWDGSPLFRDPVLYPGVTFCTQMILDIAREHQFTNFRFEPMEGPFDLGGKGIDYLKTPRKSRQLPE